VEKFQVWPERFKTFFLNNKFVVFLLVLLLIGVNVLVFSRIPFVFRPLSVLVHTVALPVILSGVGYYLLDPLVSFIEKRTRISRGLIIGLLYLLIAGGITLVLIMIIPLIRTQVTGLADNFPAYSTQLQAEFEGLVGSDLMSWFQETIGTDFTKLTDQLTAWGSGFLQSAVSGVGTFVGAVTAVVLGLVTTPFILFYLLRDGSRLPDYMLKAVPTGLRKQTRQVLSEMNSQIASYIRGQIIVSFCIGVLLYIGYLIIGLEYALVLAIVAACTAVVPYLGPAIAITPALIVAMVTSPFMLLKMVAVWTAVQLVEGKFISPQIMGKSLRVHPVTIIFVIVFAGKLFGVLGIILAVPSYAVLKVIATHIFQWFRLRSGLYGIQEQAVDSEGSKDSL
jgi:predicted PurR-regulated permease PerM